MRYRVNPDVVAMGSAVRSRYLLAQYIDLPRAGIHAIAHHDDQHIRKRQDNRPQGVLSSVVVAVSWLLNSLLLSFPGRSFRMDVFGIRNRLINDYASYIRSFIHLRDPIISKKVYESLTEGLLWPDPLIQLNPAFEPGEWVEELASSPKNPMKAVHSDCTDIRSMPFKRRNPEPTMS
jgi:hypothetical protein